MTSTIGGAGSAASQCVHQKPIPVAAAGICLAGLALDARLIRVPRQQPDQGSQARYTASAGQARNRVQRTAGQIVGKAQGTATRTAGKSGIATVVGKAPGVAARPAQDKVVKNALADSSAEQLELSSFKALIAAAHDLGDQETVSMCQQILQDEEEMARFLDQNLPTVVIETMNRIPAAAS